MMLGIIGGVSWHSSAEYYKQLNRAVAQTFGRRRSARIVLSSLDFADLLNWQRDPSHAQLKDAFLLEGTRLKAAGCDAFLIASHTLTWLGEYIESAIGLPHVGLYEALFSQLRKQEARTVGLMGTRYTMTDPVYLEHYKRAGFGVVTPDEPLRGAVAEIIYKELVQGHFSASSEKTVLDCAASLAAGGADAVVLGCTELGLLVKKRSLPVRVNERLRHMALIDPIAAHVEACMTWLQR